MGECAGSKETARRRRMRLAKWQEWPFCCYCKKRLGWSETTLDHVIPVVRGGLTSRGNTVLSCQPCNVKKADR